jgi:hypothetical protein
MTTTTTPSTMHVRRDSDRRENRTERCGPSAVTEDGPAPATSTGEWMTYPGVRYAFERLDAVGVRLPREPPQPGRPSRT